MKSHSMQTRSYPVLSTKAGLHYDFLILPQVELGEYAFYGKMPVESKEYMALPFLRNCLGRAVPHMDAKPPAPLASNGHH